MSELDNLKDGTEYDVQGTVDMDVTVTLRAPFTEEEAKQEMLRAASYGDGEAFAVMIDGVTEA